MLRHIWLLCDDTLNSSFHEASKTNYQSVVVRKSRNHITDGTIFDPYMDNISRKDDKDNALQQNNQQSKTKSNNFFSPAFNSPYNQDNKDDRFIDNAGGKIESICIRNRKLLK